MEQKKIQAGHFRKRTYNKVDLTMELSPKWSSGDCVNCSYSKVDWTKKYQREQNHAFSRKMT